MSIAPLHVMRLTFFGSAGTVTGSKCLVENTHTSVLVDCGLFQGLKALRLRNWDEPPVAPRQLSAVILTHGHLDHSGYLPLLVRNGFSGPIWCTEGTAALCRVLLKDAAYIAEEDARRANRYGYTRHEPALPLYTAADVERALPMFRTVQFDTPFKVGDLTITLVPVGHMLGASSVRIEHEGKSAFFSGDVGRPNDLLMHPPSPFQGADTLVLESTYGDRRHTDKDVRVELAEVVNRVCGRGGVLMVPAFAVGRAQALLHLLAGLTRSGAIPHIPTFLNSPMAIDATTIFQQHPDEHRLSPADVTAMRDAAVFTRDVESSKALNTHGGPMIVIAGSGMATGGRILHHLATYGRDPNNGVLLVGYQAAGTRGAAIRAGAESVKIHGVQVPINAQRFTIDGLSGHADWKEIVTWLRSAPRAPSTVLLNHGEASAADAMRVHLRDELGWDATIAVDGRSYPASGDPQRA